MTDTFPRRLLGLLKSRRGWSIDDLFDNCPDPLWAMCDALRPIHMLVPALKRLIETGLAEAFIDEQEKPIEAARLDDRDETGYIYERARFFISPKAIEIEQTIGGELASARRPLFGEPLTEWEGPDVFVLMPFAEEMRPVFEDHIAPMVRSLGLKAGRADDLFLTGSVVQQIWSAIHHAKVVVADCTKRNPNVFYEIGIAHTIGKDTILIAQTIDDVPFDLRSQRVIVYQYTPRGMREMERSLWATLAALLKWQGYRIRQSGQSDSPGDIDWSMIPS